ncbi:UNVERIFIED_CONTAM: Fur family transcriptional regulator [Kocuria sp. CPCC 205300]
MQRATRQRATRQRAAVMELLEHATQFLSAQQIHDVLIHRGHALGLATVYRTLQALTDTGELDLQRAEDGEHLYRRCHRQGPHHHLVCRACGAAVGLPGTGLERWAARQGQVHGFTRTSTTVELRGLCPSCSTDPVPSRSVAARGRAARQEAS